MIKTSKIDESIALIRKGEKLALALNPRTTYNIDADEYYDCWKSKKSIKEWMEEKKTNETILNYECKRKSILL